MRTTRKYHIGFWQGIGIMIGMFIGWLLLGWLHLQFNRIPSVIIDTVLWAGVSVFVAWLIKRCANDENLTVRSWFKKLFRSL